MIKQKFTKLISCILALTILSSIIPSLLQPSIMLSVYATTESEIDEASLEAQYEYFNLTLLASAGDWSTAHYKDGCAWNFFHNEVQSYIREKNLAMDKEELSITFKEPTLNPVTGKYSLKGKADLYQKDE